MKLPVLTTPVQKCSHTFLLWYWTKLHLILSINYLYYLFIYQLFNCYSIKVFFYRSSLAFHSSRYTIIQVELIKFDGKHKMKAIRKINFTLALGSKLKPTWKQKIFNFRRNFILRKLWEIQLDINPTASHQLTGSGKSCWDFIWRKRISQCGMKDFLFWA